MDDEKVFQKNTRIKHVSLKSAQSGRNWMDGGHTNSENVGRAAPRVGSHPHLLYCPSALLFFKSSLRVQKISLACNFADIGNPNHKNIDVSNSSKHFEKKNFIE